MYIRSLCLRRRVSFRAGLLLLSLGLLHITLSPLWIPYSHLTGHARDFSIDFLSGLAIGIGIVLLVSSFGNSEDNSDEDHSGNPGTSI